MNPSTNRPINKNKSVYTTPAPEPSGLVGHPPNVPPLAPIGPIRPTPVLRVIHTFDLSRPLSSARHTQPAMLCVEGVASALFASLLWGGNNNYSNVPTPTHPLHPKAQRAKQLVTNLLVKCYAGLDLQMVDFLAPKIIRIQSVTQLLAT